MAELLMLIHPHHTDSSDKAGIDSSDTKLNGYITRKGPGFVPCVMEDGHYATPSNPKGKPWNGAKFWLVKIPGTVAEHKDKIKWKTVKVQTSTIEKDISVLDEVLDLNSIMADAKQEVWECRFPGAKESVQFRYIYTFTDKTKLKTKKEVHDKTDKIMTTKSIKDAT